MTTARKILVLESDRAAAFPLGAGLRKAGWIVIAAHDAAMAMSFARQQKPDAVLLNARLAGGGGLVALKRLRSSVYTTLIPVICIVATDSPERPTLIAAGAQETVEPPGDPQAIDAALRRHIAQGETVPQVPEGVLRDPERVKALRESQLLDTPPEERFDRVTRLAGRLMETPLARLSIVDIDRQFFKSQITLSGAPPKVRQTPLSHSICQWVVGGNEELIVGNAREHPVLRSSLAVREDGVGAYAGVPFTIDGMTTLGSFCVVDSKPHVWSEEQVASLRDLGLIVQAYATLRQDADDSPFNLAPVGKALISATRVVLRNHAQYDATDRELLSQIVQEVSARLTRLSQTAVPVG